MAIASPDSRQWPNFIPDVTQQHLELYGWLEAWRTYPYLASHPGEYACRMFLKPHPNYAGDANLHSTADAFRALNASSNAVLMVLLHAEPLQLVAFQLSLDHRPPMHAELDFTVATKSD